MNNVIVMRQLIERLAAVFFFIIITRKIKAMYGFYQQPYGEQLIRVTGIDCAKAYQMRPNSAVALFDGAEDIFYIKSTDGAAVPGMNATQTIKAIGDTVTLGTSGIVRVYCGKNSSTLTIVIGGQSVTGNNLAIDITKQ